MEHVKSGEKWCLSLFAKRKRMKTRNKVVLFHRETNLVNVLQMKKDDVKMLFCMTSVY